MNINIILGQVSCFFLYHPFLLPKNRPNRPNRNSLFQHHLLDPDLGDQQQQHGVLDVLHGHLADRDVLHGHLADQHVADEQQLGRAQPVVNVGVESVQFSPFLFLASWNPSTTYTGFLMRFREETPSNIDTLTFLSALVLPWFTHLKTKFWIQGSSTGTKTTVTTTTMSTSTPFTTTTLTTATATATTVTRTTRTAARCWKSFFFCLYDPICDIFYNLKKSWLKLDLSTQLSQTTPEPSVHDWPQNKQLKQLSTVWGHHRDGEFVHRHVTDHDWVQQQHVDVQHGHVGDFDFHRGGSVVDVRQENKRKISTWKIDGFWWFLMVFVSCFLFFEKKKKTVQGLSSSCYSWSTEADSGIYLGILQGAVAVQPFSS